MQEKTIGEKIREYRQKKGLTQDALAAELHVSSQAVSKWENGQTMPDINLLVPLSKVLKIGLNDLLGTDRRAEFEHRFQKMIPLGEEMTLLVSEEALKEFPDDRDFLYRRACDCFFIGERKNDKQYLTRACIYFSDLHRLYPDDDSYVAFLARSEFQRGNRDRALDYAYKIKDPKVRNSLIPDIFGGDEKIRYSQKDLEKKFYELFFKLFKINTRESINAAYSLIDAMMPESKKLNPSYPTLLTHDARLCLDEGNIDGFVQKYKEAYEVVKEYNSLPREPIAYTDPLFDRLTHVPESTEALRDFICHIASYDKARHPALLDLRRKIVRDNIGYRPLHRHEWKNFFNFCRAYIVRDGYINFGMGCHVTEEEDRANFDEIIKNKGGHAKIIEMYMGQIERFVGGGIAKGTVACFENEFFGFCHCGEKESFASLRISDEAPTAPEGSKILSIVEIMIANNFRRMGVEEKLISHAFEDALRVGYTHAEVYLLERMDDYPDRGRFDELFEIYQRMGFKIIRDLSNEMDGKYYIMQRELCHVSTDSLGDFEFHDSTWKFDSLENGNLTVKISGLNIHKKTLQNASKSDMEIKEATVTFTGVRNLLYTLPRTWRKDENGNSVTDDPLVVYKDDEAMGKFIAELRSGIMVQFFEEKNGLYEFGGSGNEYVSFDFAFDSVRIEWESYDQKAWYEGHKRYDKQLTLSTPGGDVTVKAMLREHDVPVFYGKVGEGKLVDPPSMSITLTYDGKNYWSDAICHTWEEAFAALQRGLPEGVKVKCCLTCRHGNFCPYGNKSGEIFCLKNDKPKNKLDVCDLLNGDKDLNAKRKDISFVCPEYSEASEEHYAYNDYLYSLAASSNNDKTLGDGTFYEEV